MPTRQPRTGSPACLLTWWNRHGRESQSRAALKPGHDSGWSRAKRWPATTHISEEMRQPKVAADHLFVFSTAIPSTGTLLLRWSLGPFCATTNDTGEVFGVAVRLGERLWRKSPVTQCDVMTTELLPEAVQQPALWSESYRERRERAWKKVDRLYASLGRGTIRILSAGPKDAAWKLRAECRSPRWDELPAVRAR